MCKSSVDSVGFHQRALLTHQKSVAHRKKSKWHNIQNGGKLHSKTTVTKISEYLCRWVNNTHTFSSGYLALCVRKSAIPLFLPTLSCETNRTGRIVLHLLAIFYKNIIYDELMKKT
jgi:hypothetical protein